MASPSELPVEPLNSRLNNPSVMELFSKLGYQPEELPLFQIMDKKLVQLAAMKVTGRQHTLDTPRLHFLAGLDFYKGWRVDPIKNVDIEFLRWLKIPGVKVLLADSLKEDVKDCDSRAVSSFPCRFVRTKKKQYRDLVEKQKSSTDLKEALSAYHRLRQNAWIPPDMDFVNKASARVESLDKNKALDVIPLLIQQIVFEGHAKKALNGLETWHKQKLITDSQRDFFTKKIRESSSLLDLLKHFKEK